MKFIANILITAFNAFVLSQILPGVNFANISAALIVAVVLAFLNAIVKPLLILLTLPVTILTLGFFLLVINTIIILIADYFVAGFTTKNFWYAFLFSLLLSFFNSFVYKRVFPTEEDNTRNR